MVEVGGPCNYIINYSFPAWKGFDAIKVEFICISEYDCHAADNFPLSYCIEEERMPFDS